MPAAGLSSPRLARLAARSPAPGPGSGDDGEHCELCGRPIETEHRHLLDVQARALVCCCRPCSLLFERPAAAGGRLRRIPDRPGRLEGFELEPTVWAQLDIPVQMAWFVHDSSQGRVLAFYPSPLGPTASQLELSAWDQLQAANPVLAAMAPDVEALLVNRTARRPGEWIAPISECYRLVAVIRTAWKGFTGGRLVWEQLEGFFDDLDRRARPRAARGGDPQQGG